jgi:hypothetical protein
VQLALPVLDASIAAQAERQDFAMETPPLILHLAVMVCMAGFLVSLCVVFSTGLLVYSRTWKPGDRDRNLSWGERAGRSASRFNEFLVADEFRSLRRLYFSAWAGAIGSFGLLSLFALLLKRS